MKVQQWVKSLNKLRENKVLDAIAEVIASESSKSIAWYSAVGENGYENVINRVTVLGENFTSDRKL